MSPHGSTIVREVISSTNSGADVMSALPGLVRQLLDEEAWREFTVNGLPQPVRHSTFTSFVKAGPPKGLGGKSAALVALCGADEGLRQRVERLLMGEIPEASKVGHKSKRTTLENIDYSVGPESETVERVVRRLKRADPELADRVVNGEVSAYAAARSKGWKPPRIQVTTPERTAAQLRKHMTPDQLVELARLLADER